MEIRVLRYFLAVAGEGNVTRAAEMLHVTQPTLSRQLADLEKEVGCPLFTRSSKGVELTEAGRLLRQRAEELVDLADRTVSDLAHPSDEVAGTVYMGLAETRSVSYVADAFRLTKKQYPGVTINVHSGEAQYVIDHVESGVFDIGLLVGHGVPDSCDMMFLPRTDRWGLLVPKDDPLASRGSILSKELSGMPLIMSSQRNHAAEAGSTGYLPGAADLDVVGRFNLAFNGSVFVERGCGYAITLEGVPGSDNDNLVFIPIVDAIPLRSIVIWKKGAKLSRAAEALLDNLHLLCAV